MERANIIKSNGPAPGRRNLTRYEWENLGIGDYVIVPKKRGSYAANARAYCKRKGLDRVFYSLTVEGELRIYRES